jgi:Na+/proline symporter
VGSALNGFFVGLVVFGTDQELVQRLLTVKTRKSSQKTIIATIVAGLPMPLIYLTVGSLLYLFYQQNPAHAPITSEAKNVFSHFAKDVLPMGLKGIVLAAVVLASIDSPLGSLTTSFVTDIYRPLIRRRGSDRHYLWVSRIAVVAFGVILAGVAYECRHVVNVLWFAFEVFGVTGGSLLGIFLLGILTKRKGDYGNITAMVFSAALSGVLLYAIELKLLRIDWTWLIVLGTFSTFAIGYLLGSPPAASDAAQADRPLPDQPQSNIM